MKTMRQGCGQATVEYAVLATILVLASILVITVLGDGLRMYAGYWSEEMNDHPVATLGAQYPTTQWYVDNGYYPIAGVWCPNSHGEVWRVEETINWPGAGK